MTLLAFALFVVAVAVMVYVHYRTQNRLADRVVERERELNDLMERRAQTMDKQAKVFVRKLERTRRLADRTLDQSRDINQRVETALGDPRVQRLLNEGKSRRG